MDGQGVLLFLGRSNRTSGFNSTKGPYSKSSRGNILKTSSSGNPWGKQQHLLLLLYFIAPLYYYCPVIGTLPDLPDQPGLPVGDDHVQSDPGKAVGGGAGGGADLQIINSYFFCSSQSSRSP